MLDGWIQCFNANSEGLNHIHYHLLYFNIWGADGLIWGAMYEMEKIDIYGLKVAKSRNGLWCSDDNTDNDYYPHHRVSLLTENFQ